EIVRWAPDKEVLNPRRLKKYINWISMTLQLLNASRLPSPLGTVDALRALALRRDYPEVYSRRRDGMKSNLADMGDVLTKREMSREEQINQLAFRDYLERIDEKLVKKVDGVLGENPLFSELLKNRMVSFRDD